MKPDHEFESRVNDGFTDLPPIYGTPVPKESHPANERREDKTKEEIEEEIFEYSTVHDHFTHVKDSHK